MGARPRPAILEPTDAIVRIDSSTICGTDLHILKGDVPEVTPRHGPRPRGRRHRRRGRRGRHDGRGRRPRAGLVHHVVRALPLLQGGPLRPVPRRRRLDLRPPDRRHCRPSTCACRSPTPRSTRCPTGSPTSRCCSSPTSCRRPTRSACSTARVRPGDVVAIVGAGPDRAGRDHDRAPLHPRADRRDRPRRLPASRRRSEFGADVAINNGREDARRAGRWS